MADPNIPASPSILHSPSHSGRLSSKFCRKSKFLTKSNVNVDSPDICRATSTNDSLLNHESSVPPLTHQQPPSEMSAPITNPPGVLHSTEKNLRGAGSLQKSKQAPLMEVIPLPLSHQLQVTTPLRSATSVASSNDDCASIPALQSLTEVQYTPLTEGQIDDAKNIVLDLLGWGVDPEYLVTSGVHPELIYRIFTDLNLRLPTNLVLFDETENRKE